MARTVQLACARCGHSQMYVVESAENYAALAENLSAVDDLSTSEAIRLERLKYLPTSLPVGGIITPV
jgi:hypothetical protein